jgi:hypothetical protein
LEVIKLKNAVKILSTVQAGFHSSGCILVNVVQMDTPGINLPEGVRTRILGAA